MVKLSFSTLPRYAGAIVAVIVATAARMALAPVLGSRFPFATLFLAVLVVVGYAGPGPALLTVGLGGLASAWFLLPPEGSFAVEGAEYQVGLVLYLAVGIGIALLGGALGRARRDAEAHAREASRRDEQARTVLESITDAFCAFDRDWRFVYMNRQAEELLGRTRKDLIGKRQWEVYPETLGTSIERNFRRAMAENVAHTFLNYFPPHDRWYEVDAYPSAEGLSVYFRDVTPRKRAEDERARLVAVSEQQRRTYATALSNSPDYHFIFDLQGCFTFANTALLDLWQKGLDEALGKDLFELDYPPDLAARLHRQTRQVIDSRQPVRDETPFVSHLGERHYEYILVPVLGADGAVEAVVGSARDDTERKQAESALRQSEERFRHLANAMPQIVWIVRPDHTVEFYNERWFQYTGLTAEESYSPGGWRSALHPDDIAPVLEASARSAAAGEPFQAEFRLKDRFGVYRWHLGRAVEVRDEAGRIVRRFGTSTDIDDRKRAERDATFLAVASATLAAIVDEASTLRKVAHLAVPSFADWCAVDLAGDDGVPQPLAVAHVQAEKVALAHEYYRRYPPDPNDPHGVPEVIRSGTPRLVSEITDEMIATGARDEDHLRLLRALGLKSFLCVPLKGRDRTLGAISFIAAESGRHYDRDDLRLAEDLAARAAIALDNARLFREVRESEQRFRQLADAMPQIVWTARPDGHLDYYNKRWYEFTGLPEGIGGDESWLPILHPDDLRPCLDRWYAAVKSGLPYEIEYRFRDHVTGAYRWHLGRALPVRDESGRVVKWFGTATDIDDRKQAEGALRAARDEAEEANRAKTQFLAVLSHELRTPLNPILLAASSMLDRPCDPDELRPTLEMIRQNVNLQARLIDDLLDVMRIVRGKMPLHWEVADCHELIAHAVQICRSELSGGQLQLVADLAAVHHHGNADPARWQQVLWNLIKNAVKFTPEGGTITIRTLNVGGDGDGDGRGERLVIEVSDTGIGIAPEVLPRIFEPFQQGETTITRKFGGLGLGLAISRGIVEAHGGTIVARSEGEGRGTTFRVELPALPAPKPVRNEEATSGTAGTEPTTRRRVLVVEDDAATQRLMTRLLKGLGHEVTTAATTAEALERVVSADFDLVVSDIGLPDGTGLDLMRRIVSRRGPIPAIALTGYGMEDDIQRCREAGFTAHMTKPIDFTKLEAMIRRVTTDGAAAGRSPLREEASGW